jgi:hypothetical protein
MSINGGMFLGPKRKQLLPQEIEATGVSLNSAGRVINSKHVSLIPDRSMSCTSSYWITPWAHLRHASYFRGVRTRGFLT